MKLIEAVCSCYFKDRKPRLDPGVGIGEKVVSVAVVINVVVVGDEDVVVDMLSEDVNAAVVVDFVIGDCVVDVDMIVVVDGVARVVVIFTIIVVADVIMAEEYVTDDCVIFSVGDGGITIVVVVAVTGCSEVFVDVFINCVFSGEGS